MIDSERQESSAAIPAMPPASKSVAGKTPAIENILASADFHRLERALKRARGFALYFIRCNLPAHRLELMAHLRAAVGRPAVEVKLPDDYTFLSIIARATSESPAEALVFISGLENLLPSYDESRRHQTLEILNWQRGALARLQRPLIFWLPEYLVPLLAEGAPDFWDWHSGLYEFDTPQTMREASFQTLVEGESREAWNLNSQEKRERMVLLRSLLEEYKGATTTEISARGRTAQKLGDLHQSIGDYQNALEYFQSALKAYEMTEDRAGLATSYNNLGLIFKARGDYAVALQWYQKSVEINEALRNRAVLATSYNNIGEVHRARGDYEAALQWYQKSVAIEEALGDRAGLATSYNNIGLIYGSRGDYDVALQWYQKSVDIREALGDHAGLATSYTYNNIGQIYGTRGDYDDALQWYQKSVAITEALGDRVGLATSYNNIGSIYSARGDYAAAVQWYQKSAAIREDICELVGLAVTLHNLGNIAQIKQDWPTALAYFTRSRDLYQQMGLEKKAQEEEALIAEIKKKIR